MEIIKEIPTDIIAVIKDLEEGSYPRQHPYEAGSRSIIYKIDNYCLKVYTAKGIIDGEFEYKALLSLQGTITPTLYAYSSGIFILTEWIEGLNLLDYRSKHGHFPPNLIYDWFRTELLLLEAGYKDWDFKLYENIVWLDSGEVKRLDLGICEPIPESAIEYTIRSLKREIQDIYDDKLYEVEQELLSCGINAERVAQSITTFQSTEPKLV